MSVIFLEDGFRGKSYKKKPYSEILMETALQTIEGNYPKNILAYVQKGNKEPSHLFNGYRFKREPSDREGYILYTLDLAEMW